MKHAPRILIILLLASLFLGGIFPAQAAPNLVGTPVLIAYDSFTRADGTIGSTETTGPASESLSAYAWTGGAISGNKSFITPTLGSELITNGGFDTDTGWQKGSGYIIADGVLRANAVTTVNTNQSFSGFADRWYQAQFDITNYSTGSLRSYVGSNGGISPTYNTSGPKLYTTRYISGGANLFYLESLSASNTYDLDNVSLKQLTLYSLFSTVSTGYSNVIVQSNNNSILGTQAGVVINLDSTSNPQNFVIAYHNGTNIRLEKNVGGTYTTLINTAVSYVAGATLRVEKDGTTYKLFYNGTQRGTDQTITDAGIINNTIHGLFSTYSGNTFDNFYLYDNNPATATPTSTATFTATATETETPTATATGTLEPTYTPTITETPSNTPEPTATITSAPVNLPTLNAEEFTLSSGHTFQVERRATFGEVGVMLSLLCISMPFGALALLNYLNKKR